MTEDTAVSFFLVFTASVWYNGARKGVNNMKLDYDCLRSLLLKLEDFENLDDDLCYQSMTLDDMEKALTNF